MASDILKTVKPDSKMGTMASDILKAVKPEQKEPSLSEKESMVNMAEGILKKLKPGPSIFLAPKEKESAKEAAKRQLLGAASAVQNAAQIDSSLEMALF